MIKNFFENNNIKYYEDISLKKYNTYRIDTKCKYLVFPQNEEELINILKEIKKEKIKYLVLGNGSNIIFSMDYYNGVIIKLDNLCELKVAGTIVSVGAGYSLIKFANEMIELGLGDLTFAAGIPGQVGASTAMNAGAYNHDMSMIVKKVRVIDDNLDIVELSNKELSFSYRDSFLKKHPEYIVLSTTFELEKHDISEMKNKVIERRNKRYASQPLNLPSAGSVFRNPENMHAGELIEKSNLKGYNVNGAEVSSKHANFIVNNGNATGKDIIKLINIIKEKVKEKYNIELLLEQIIIE